MQPESECRQSEWMDKAKKAAWLGAGLCAAAGLGAGLMYFLDPHRGKARRNMMRDKCFSLARHGLKEADHRLADFEHRAKGMVAEAKAILHRGEDTPDPKLEARIRSRLGRCVDHPHAVHVTSMEGRIILTGEVSPLDARRAETAARLTPGVKSVENLLELTT
ncbi:MAG: BON domain-containing protein [Bryobacterales bacterium]|nr:BON domain-containing protein [Bryobacterales bacterium]